MTRGWLGAGMVLGLVGVAVGCSSGKPAAKPDKVVAQQKLEAITRLADHMAKNPNGPEAAVAFDEFGNLMYDPQSLPEESQAILDVYDQRIK